MASRTSSVLLLGNGEDAGRADAALALHRAGHDIATLTPAGDPVADRGYSGSQRLAEALEVVAAERAHGPFAGVLPQFGGPAALELGARLAEADVPVLGATRSHVPEAEPATLAGAIAIEVDALFDGVELFLGAIGECLEPFGSDGADGSDWPDTGVVLPAFSLGRRVPAALCRQAVPLARRLGVRGPLHLRFVLHHDRLVPVSATPMAAPGLACAGRVSGVDLGQAATRLLLGDSIRRLRAEGLLPAGVRPAPPTAVRIDSATGVADSVGAAYARARVAAGDPLPSGGAVLVSLAGRELREALLPVCRLADLGFRVLAGPEHAETLRRNGIDCAEPGTGPVALELRTAAGATLAAQGIEAQRTG